MKLHHVKILLISSGLVIALFIVSSGALVLVPRSTGEQFSELFILNYQRQAADYPHNIVPDKAYPLFLNVENHVGNSVYYLVYIKLLTVSENLPNVKLKTASPTDVLYENRFIILNDHAFEYPITFSINTTNNEPNQITIDNLNINGEMVAVDKVVEWDPARTEFPFRLLFELWVYDTELNMFQYNNRCVYLELNVET